jgi:hypothetical protein
MRGGAGDIEAGGTADILAGLPATDSPRIVLIPRILQS